MGVETYPPCTGKPDPRSVEQHRHEREERRSRLMFALVDGPATTSELRERMGTHEWQATSFWGADCKGHLMGPVYTTMFGVADINNDLNRLLRQGRVVKVKMAGWQRALWSLKP